MKLKKVSVFIYAFLFSSCAKFSYLTNQGIGQLSLLNNAKKNRSVLEDPRISKEHKRKIKLIEKYKDYFYSYFQKEKTKIYSKTTMLENKAVTYLVIASSFNEIKAHKECFPVMGCFPYLGFFKKEAANEYQRSLEEKGFYTYQRPVFAYSTLGYFTDPILSSFFSYNDYDLAELIFHELFHTVFFASDEVKFNENLANYFGKEMMEEYFKDNKDFQEKVFKKKTASAELRKELVRLVGNYKLKLAKSAPKDRVEADTLLEGFLNSDFYPSLKKKCSELKLKECNVAKKKWNNASMSAYLTYTDQLKPIHELRLARKENLKEFLKFIINSYEEFDGKNFSKYLLKKRE